MALTRNKLLDAAWDVFVEVGYEQATVERIAARAGFTRGAFYRHFESRIVLYLEVVTIEAGRMAPGMQSSIDGAETARDAVEILVEWARSRVLGQHLGFLLIEVLQHATRAGLGPEVPFAPLRAIWARLGSSLRPFLAEEAAPITDEELGAYVLQLIHAPIVEGAGGPNAARLVEIGLRSLLRI